MNHNFLLKVVEDEFKSHDFGSAKDLLLHDVPNERAYVLGNVDIATILVKLKAIVDIKEKHETKVVVTQEHVEKVKKYLIMLDLIVNCPDRYENGKQAEHFIFTQPGMRYAIAKALVYSLMQDEYFKSVSEIDKKYIVDKILNDVKGRMLEEIVLLESIKALPTNYEVFKFKFDNGGEYDMVVYDRTTNTCRLYEVKHSDKIVDRQVRFLIDDDKCNLVEQRYGKIVGKYVLYRGENTILENGIEYKNVEEYLQNIV